MLLNNLATFRHVCETVAAIQGWTNMEAASSLPLSGGTDAAPLLFGPEELWSWTQRLLRLSALIQRDLSLV